MRNERMLVLAMRIVPSIYRRFRSRLYGVALNAKGLKLGRNTNISGTKNIVLGNNVLIGNQSWIDAIDEGEIIIGNNVSLSQNVHIAAKLGVLIGENCLIGSDVLITDHNHIYGKEYANIAPKERGISIKGKTVIGRNCWLCDNVKILSGVVLGDNIVVAANSVVTSAFPSNCVIGGTPARIIKEI